MDCTLQSTGEVWPPPSKHFWNMRINILYLMSMQWTKKRNIQTTSKYFWTYFTFRTTVTLANGTRVKCGAFKSNNALCFLFFFLLGVVKQGFSTSISTDPFWSWFTASLWDCFSECFLRLKIDARVLPVACCADWSDLLVTFISLCCRPQGVIERKGVCWTPQLGFPCQAVLVIPQCSHTVYRHSCTYVFIYSSPTHLLTLCSGR